MKYTDFVFRNSGEFMSGKKSTRTKIFAVIPIVMGVICAISFLWNAYFDLVYEYRRSLIGCLVLAVVYLLAGILLRNICLKSKEKLSVQVVSLIASILLVPSMVFASIAMCAVTMKSFTYNNYESFSRWEEVYIGEEDIPDNALDCTYLKKKDGHVNAVSFRLDDCEEYENEEYEWSLPYGQDRGCPFDEFSEENEYFDFENIIIPLIGDDDINDYVVLDSNFGNEWTHERFVNRKTGRYIIVVTHD